MTTKTPQRANRSTGTVTEYSKMILRGHTLEQIGDVFGVTHGAVRKALKAAGLPTNSRRLLASIPVGCTPTDAEILRRANHNLAAENSALRAKLQAIKTALKNIESGGIGGKA